MEIIDQYDDLNDDIHTSIDMFWDQIWKAAKVLNMQSLVDFIASAIKRKRYSGNSARQILTKYCSTGYFSEGKYIYISTEPKDGNSPIKKADAEKSELIIRSQGSKDVDIYNFKLLCDASGSYIIALQAWGGEFRSLSMPLSFKYHIVNIFITL